MLLLAHIKQFCSLQYPLAAIRTAESFPSHVVLHSSRVKEEQHKAGSFLPYIADRRWITLLPAWCVHDKLAVPPSHTTNLCMSDVPKINTKHLACFFMFFNIKWITQNVLVLKGFFMSFVDDNKFRF